MSVRQEFNQAITAVEQLLDQQHTQARDVRNGIKAIFLAYQAKEVISTAYQNFDDSGVLQWKNFLRSAKVKDQEALGDYIGRMRSGLDELRSFEKEFLQTRSHSLAC